MDAAAPLRKAGKEHQKAVPEHGRHYSQDQRRGVSGKSYVFGRCTSGNTEASRTGEWEKSKRAALTPNLLVIAGTASSFAVELTPGVCPHPLHWRHSFAVQSESYDPSCRSCITPSPRSYLRRLWGCCHNHLIRPRGVQAIRTWGACFYEKHRHPFRGGHLGSFFQRQEHTETFQTVDSPLRVHGQIAGQAMLR